MIRAFIEKCCQDDWWLFWTSDGDSESVLFNFTQGSEPVLLSFSQDDFEPKLLNFSEEESKPGNPSSCIVEHQRK